jgi:raffinose/stachyose/melibiose transport system permease protein/N-acetylglucosamine transport system permease protein
VATQPRARVFLAYCLLGLWCAFTLFCLLWILVTSVKSNRELFQNVWGLPAKLHTENYLKIWNTFELRTYFKNSILIVPTSVLLILVLAAPAAYVLCRARFRGREVLLNFITIGMGIPFVILLIPLYVLLSRMRLINSLTGLITVYVSLSLPFTIFVLSGFFRSFPSQLEEAAAIDGCSPFHTYRTIVIPLSSPGLITVSIFNFIGIWNEYLLALILLTGEKKRPLSLGLYSIQSSMQYTGDWVALFAGVVLVLVPLFVFYLLMSERIIEGLTLGALKG